MACLTQLSWPTSVRMQVKEATCHSRMLRSREEDSRYSPPPPLDMADSTGEEEEEEEVVAVPLALVGWWLLPFSSAIILPTYASA